jgi:hypothetical protein
MGVSACAEAAADPFWGPVGRSLSPRLASITAWQPVRELGPRSDIEFPEYLAEVVLHRAWADEQLLGDFTVRCAVGGKACDASFLGCQVEFGIRGPRSGPLAGGAQFAARLPGEVAGAYDAEHVFSKAKLASRVAASPGAPQPLALDHRQRRINRSFTFTAAQIRNRDDLPADVGWAALACPGLAR